MIVSSQRLAAEAGIEILRRGGNAVDAAVAVGYAEAVTNPCCGNIGGGGFMVVRMADGRSAFLNFRETAPAAAKADMYQDSRDALGRTVTKPNVIGWPAVAVPGTVMGLDAALKSFGTLPRATVMARAIRLARQGFTLTRGDTDIFAQFREVTAREANVRRLFFRPDGSLLRPGDRLVQADLANTLEAIAARGPDAFYHGRIPAAVEAASRSGGGYITAADFAAYRITQEAPLRCSYRNYVIVTAQPPSAGGAGLCQILNILQGYDLGRMGHHSASAVNVIVQAIQQTYLDLATYIADPAFVTNPVSQLLAPDYAATIRSQITPRARPLAEFQPASLLPVKPNTTHYSVIDKAGNSVAVTYTINNRFGAGVVAPNTGFLMNNQMDDFSLRPSDMNAIAPGKRPRSYMAPSIVLRQAGEREEVALVIGSPGGSRIVTIVLEALLNVLDYGMQPQEAVDAPRFHYREGTLEVEPYALSPDTQAELEALGYHGQIAPKTPWGAVALIAKAWEQGIRLNVGQAEMDTVAGGRIIPGLYYGANDSRRPAGAAIGLTNGRPVVTVIGR